MTRRPPLDPGPPVTIPGWAKAATILLAIAVAALVVYQIAKTDFRLKIDEHRQIQQVSATIGVVVALAVAGFTSGVGYPAAVAAAGAVGAVGVPTVQHVGSRLVTALRPRERVLLGWLPLYVLAIVLSDVNVGWASRYLVVVAHGLVFVGGADSLALLRELADQERTTVA